MQVVGNGQLLTNLLKGKNFHLYLLFISFSVSTSIAQLVRYQNLWYFISISYFYFTSVAMSWLSFIDLLRETTKRTEPSPSSNKQYYVPRRRARQQPIMNYSAVQPPEADFPIQLFGCFYEWVENWIFQSDSHEHKKVGRDGTEREFLPFTRQTNYWITELCTSHMRTIAIDQVMAGCLYIRT